MMNTEKDILGGEDPYSASKAGAEIIFHSYVKSFSINDKKIQYEVARIDLSATCKYVWLLNFLNKPKNIKEEEINPPAKLIAMLPIWEIIIFSQCF